MALLQVNYLSPKEVFPNYTKIIQSASEEYNQTIKCKLNSHLKQN